MRIIVFFDMPTETEKDCRAYRKFRKFLIKDGYIMMQESVYSKLVINQNAVASALNRLRQNNPRSGLIQVLKITEKQFASIECLYGNVINSKLNSTERLVIL